MRISGRWIKSEDGEDWPIVPLRVLGAKGVTAEIPFLLDTGADQTLLSAEVGQQLELPMSRLKNQLHGVGSVIESQVVSTQLVLERDDGVAVNFNGDYACCLRPDVLDMSILGRDILNHFAVIIDHSRSVVLLLRDRHGYRIESTGP